MRDSRRPRPWGRPRPAARRSWTRTGGWIGAVAVLVATVATVTTAAPAEAAAAMPGGGSPGVTALCVAGDHSCAGGGYAGIEPWGYYTAFGSRDAAGRLHNCTTYAAFRAAQNGAAKPSWYGNANEWDDKARAAGVRVDGVAAAGAIAQWDGPPGSAGHVAYVESVDAEGIVTTDDNYSSQVTTRYRILRSSPSWPDHFIHLADVAGLAEGSFVQAADNNEVYRIVGGAPVYVSSWSAFGGAQPVTRVPRARIDALPRHPADGTFVGAGPHVYRFAGGAPTYVSTWAAVGGPQPVTAIDPAAVERAGGASPWHHVARYPADGTVIGTASDVFVVAGGAPVYVSDWAAIGGARPVTVVDQAAVDNAGGATPWDHLRRTPADGTFLADRAGTVHRVAGGAPLRLSSWAPWGGTQPSTLVDGAAIANAGGAGVWSHLEAIPRDGTVLRTAPSDRYWLVRDRSLIPSPVAPAVLVNDSSVAGLPGAVGATTYVLSYTDAERDRLLKSAAWAGQRPEDLPRWAVTLFQFLIVISNPRPAPTKVATPSMAGTTRYTTTWDDEALPVLEAFGAQYGLGPAEAQKFAVNLLGFVLILSGQ